MVTTNPLREQKKILIYATVIVVVVVLTYMRGLGNSFVADDYFQLPNQSFVNVWAQVAADFRLRFAILPLDWLLYQVLGMNYVGYHLFTLGLHIINCLLVFYVASNLTSHLNIGMTTALIFAVYPRNHQTVLWWASHHLLLGLLFILFSIAFFQAYLQTKRKKWQILCFASMGLAALFSEVGIVAIVLLPLVEILVSYKGNLVEFLHNWRGYLKYLPYLLIPAFYVLFALTTFGPNGFANLFSSTQTGSSADYHLNSIGPGLVKEGISYLTYLLLPQVPLRALNPNLFTILLAGGLSLGLIVFLIKGTPLIQFSILWMVIEILPFVFFVQSGNADRYFYVSAVGFCLFSSVLLWWLVDRVQKVNNRIGTGLVGLVVLLFVGTSFGIIQQRVNEWHQGGVEFSAAVQTIKAKYSNPPAGSNFRLVNFPEYKGQTYLFNGFGILRAVKREYPADLNIQVLKSNDPAVIKTLETTSEVRYDAPPVYIFYYKDGQILDKSNLNIPSDFFDPAKWLK